MEFTIKLTFVEIYCEKIRDLLEPLSNNIRIKELPSGELVKAKEAMVYLGGLLSADGRCSTELSRRLGAAAADFEQLTVLWSHSNVSRAFKVQV